MEDLIFLADKVKEQQLQLALQIGRLRLLQLISVLEQDVQHLPHRLPQGTVDLVADQETTVLLDHLHQRPHHRSLVTPDHRRQPSYAQLADLHEGSDLRFRNLLLVVQQVFHDNRSQLLFMPGHEISHSIWVLMFDLQDVLQIKQVISLGRAFLLKRILDILNQIWEVPAELSQQLSSFISFEAEIQKMCEFLCR